MILWFRHLPELHMNLVEWNPFIQHRWFRENYMKLVYFLQFIIFLFPFIYGGWLPHVHLFVLILIGILVFITHEALHIIVIYKKGDISLTFSGIFFWLHTNAILSKLRFWFFMSLPFIALSILPFIISFFATGEFKSILFFISWINAMFSASDIVNSFLIAIKPKNSLFRNGYYRVQSDRTLNT